MVSMPRTSRSSRAGPVWPWPLPRNGRPGCSRGVSANPPSPASASGTARSISTIVLTRLRSVLNTNLGLVSRRGLGGRFYHSPHRPTHGTVAIDRKRETVAWLGFGIVIAMDLKLGDVFRYALLYRFYSFDSFGRQFKRTPTHSNSAMSLRKHLQSLAGPDILSRSFQPLLSHPTQLLGITLHTITSPLLRSPTLKLSSLTLGFFPFSSRPCSQARIFFLVPSQSITTAT